MIVTCKPHISFWWIFFSILPWAALGFQGNICGTGFVFTIGKFLENPAALTFILSLPGLMNIVVSPFFTFLSDRVWTRFGRRKPFAVVSWIGLTGTLVALPFCPNLTTLSLVFLLHGFFEGMCQTLVPLKLEIIPPHQRGVSVAAMEWTRNIANITFAYIALGRFDDVAFLGAFDFALGGERVIYLSGGLVMLALLAFIALGIKEVDQKSPLRGQKFTLKNIIGGLAHNDLWPVYTLIFSAAFLGAGIGPLGTLLQTEQWQFSKQMIGINIAVGGVLNIFLIAVLGIFADRMDRLKSYQVLITIALFLKFAYYLYIQFLLPNRIPSLVEVILFGEMLSIIGILKSMVYVPLTTDYVRRNQLGTFQSGSSLMQRLIGFITVNGAGLFIYWYSSLLMPPAGDMVRVVTRDPLPQAEVERLIASATWASPVDGRQLAEGMVSATPWYANGTVSSAGRCWEFRLRDPDSERLAARKAELEQERSELLRKEELAKYRMRTRRDAHDQAGASAAEAEAAGLKSKADTIKRQQEEIAATLKTRAGHLQRQVERTLGDRLVTEVDRVSSARMLPALVVEWPIAERPDSAPLEKTLVDLRLNRSDLIDLKVIRTTEGYALAASLLADTTDPQAQVQALRTDVRQVLDRRLPSLLTAEAPQTLHHAEALELGMPTVERTIDDRISPVTRVTNGILGWFDAAPPLEQRLGGVARSLRKPGQTEHVRVFPGPGEAHDLRVVALLGPQAPVWEEKEAKSASAAAPTGSASAARVTRESSTAARIADTLSDPLGQRLRDLLGDERQAAIARVFYQRFDKAAAGQRVTVAKPLVEANFANMRYDYMSGYIYMFILGLFGLWITFMFAAREKKGLIHKYGVMEADEELKAEQEAKAREAGIRAEAAANGNATPAEGIEEPRYYVPGYSLTKLGVALAFTALFIWGCLELARPFGLLFKGSQARAECVRVVKSKVGDPDQVFLDDTRLDEKSPNSVCEKSDRGFTFWNYYVLADAKGQALKDAQGRQIEVRCPVGEQLKPLNKILDENGLPFAYWVRYDPADPTRIIFPSLFSTWFMAGMLTSIGLLGAVIGFVLFATARRPIELPRLHRDTETSMHLKPPAMGGH